MNKKYDETLITSIITQHNNGHSVASLCAEHRIPRSTIYFWLKQHRTLKSSTGAEVSYKDYHNLQRRYNKLEEILKIIKESGCSLSAPLKEKLFALEKLYGVNIASTLSVTLLKSPEELSTTTSSAGEKLLNMTSVGKSSDRKSKKSLTRANNALVLRKYELFWSNEVQKFPTDMSRN